VVPRLVELIANASIQTKTPALRTLGNLVTGDDTQTQAVVDAGALAHVCELLSSSNSVLQREACWFASNVMAGTRDQIQAVIDNGLVPRIVRLLETAEFRTKKEAVWAISGCVPDNGNADAEQVAFLVSKGCITPLCDTLEIDDSCIQDIILTGLENLLKLDQEPNDFDRTGMSKGTYKRLIELCDGDTKIKALRTSTEEEVRTRAERIVDSFFSVDDTAQELSSLELSSST